MADAVKKIALVGEDDDAVEAQLRDGCGYGQGIDTEATFDFELASR